MEYFYIAIILGEVLLITAFILKPSPKRMRLAARLIGLTAVVWFSFYGFSAWIFSEAQGSEEVARFSTWIAAIALAGFLISWWRAWLGGALLIAAWMTSLGVVMYLGLVIYTSPGGYKRFLNAVLPSILVFGSLLFVASVLLLLSWRISKKSGSPA
ncbi:MAG: hypothetical protein HYX79_00060 [Chloroflexi bacterium]|nr:hypothetical protein [Chloroflexota bacterium]